MVMTKQGKDFTNGDEWHNIKIYDHKTGVEEVTNTAKYGDDEWTENWRKVGLERWCEKSGRKGRRQWNEKWYKRVFALSKKKDEQGRELDEYESDGSQVEECNCEKWGKNESDNEEWNERWGEDHRLGRKTKWCDKWQMEIST